MTRPRVSLWDHSAEEADAGAPLGGDASTDVAIVGGGFTGLSTALHCAQKGLNCHVLEAEHIGFGGSGRNAGMVNAGLWLPPQQVRQQLGETRGGKLIEQLGNAPEYVMSIIEKHQIRCEAQRNGTIHAAHSPKGFADLTARYDEWRRLGAPVDLLTRDQAADRIGTVAFHGGLLDHRAGTINPMGYVRGLARAALAAGASLSTGTRVTALAPTSDGWVVSTPNGTVTAKYVILGANAYTDELWPALKSVFTPIHYFQLATEPLGERASFILPERQALWDTGPIMFSLRRDGFGRVIIGSMGSVVGGIEGLSRRWAEKRLSKLFPDLGRVEFETGWHGRIAMTPDHLPQIHKLADGLYAPIGYNGRGITPGTIFGRAIAELLSGGKEEDLPMPLSTEIKPAPRAGLKAKLYEAAFTANQIFKSI